MCVQDIWEVTADSLRMYDNGFNFLILCFYLWEKKCGLKSCRGGGGEGQKSSNWADLQCMCGRSRAHCKAVRPLFCLQPIK